MRECGLGPLESRMIHVVSVAVDLHLAVATMAIVFAD
jgi:hypothetical protein